MLARDSRNFLGWGYRRVVVSALESRGSDGLTGSEGGADANEKGGMKGEEKHGRSMAQREFDYTTRMIKTNMSNFSAWHQRSKLIPRLMNGKGASKEVREVTLDSGLLARFMYLSWYNSQPSLTSDLKSSNGFSKPFTPTLTTSQFGSTTRI